jgi:hypothetical protein
VFEGVGRKQTFLTFIAIAASLTLALNAAEARWGPPPEAQPAVHAHLAAQAAEIPVPRPLPVESVEVAPAASTPPPADAVAVAPAPAAFAGPAPVKVAPPARLQTPAPTVAKAVESGTWAVVIGVNDYPGDANDLDYAVNDASDAVQALSLQGVDDSHVMFLRDGQVTAPVVHSAVQWLDTHAGPDAVAVFFYAGHVGKAGSSEAIVTSDGGRIRDVELADWFRPLAAKQAWFTIAACYGGGFDELLGPGRVLTAAAGPNDVAYESSTFSRSYLGEYMIHRAMIEGAANDTVQSAFSWASQHIAQDYPDREPVQFDESNGHVDLRPNSTGDAPPPDASASPPPDQPTPDQPPSDPPPPSGGADSPPPGRDCRGLLRFC